MKLPRPRGWETNPRILRVRHAWHWAHLPCPFCLLEGRYQIRARVRSWI